MPDENEFTTTENVDDNDIKKSTSKKPIVYSFLILMTGLGFVIGLLLFGFLTSGTLCVFETMSYFTGNLGGIDTSTDITVQAQNQIEMCMVGSISSPITIFAGLIGGIVFGYPTYSFIKKIMNGRKLRTML